MFKHKDNANMVINVMRRSLYCSCIHFRTRIRRQLVQSQVSIPCLRSKNPLYIHPEYLQTSVRSYSKLLSVVHESGYPTSTVADILAISKQFRSKQTHYILENQTLRDAVISLAKNENSVMLVVINKAKKVVGVVTNQIVLTELASIKSSDDDKWNTPIMKIAIPPRKILYVSPDDTIENCRAVMAMTGQGELPVLDRGSLLGTVSLTDIASLLYREEVQRNSAPTSAKSDYINLILPRTGIPTNTALETADIASAESSRCVLHSFAMSIPHPAKAETGGEDAFFLGIDSETTITSDPVDVLAMGVADGVGSWFEKGVSPREFSQELMRSAQLAFKLSSEVPKMSIDPKEILLAAWRSVLQKEIVGSSTACILTLDPVMMELHAVNLGDSGFLIIRDEKSDRLLAWKRGTLDGSLQRRMSDRDSDLTPAGRRKGAHVSYRSPQQLHYFNCPFQLGYLKSPEGFSSSKSKSASISEKPLFETPDQSAVLRVPVVEGDLIILATDGLFDNVDESDLLRIVAQNSSDVKQMTINLIAKAKELSLNRDVDSPFARLAKENDLMWGGGMPDDITIIVARVQCPGQTF